MTHYKSLVDSDWLGQWDLVKDGRPIEPVVVIATVDSYKPARIQKKKMPDGSYKVEPNKRLDIGLANGKGQPLRKHWLAGPVSQKVIAGMYGPHIEGWIGKKIKLYNDESVTFGKQRTGGVRPRGVIPGQAPTTEPLDNAPDPETAAAIAASRADLGLEEDPE